VTEGIRERSRRIGRSSSRAAAWLAWSSWGLSLALTALSLLLLDLNPSYPNAHVFDFWFEDTLVATLFATVGAIVASRRPENLVGWLLCLFGLVAAMSHFSSQYAIYAAQSAHGSLPGGELLTVVAQFLWSPYQGLIILLALLFPDGLLPSALWRWLARLTVIGIVVLTIAVTFSSIPYTGLGHVHNPIGMWGGGASRIVECICFVFVLIAAAALLARLRHARGIERQQIKWFVYAGAVLGSGDFLKYVLYWTFDVWWAWWVGLVIQTVGLIGVPIAMGIAILRYRLYEIDLIINRTLVYGSLTATLVALYFVGIVVLQRIFVLLTGQQSTLAVVASTLAIAAMFSPLRRRIQGFVDRRFYRRKYDAAKTLETFSTQLRDETDLEALRGDLVGVVAETMQPTHVSVWLRPDTAPQRRHPG
jgi:hypothetical protein